MITKCHLRKLNYGNVQNGVINFGLQIQKNVQNANIIKRRSNKMSIDFEKCNECGKIGLRVKANIKYNQSQDEFYYIWECIYCQNVVYETVKPQEIDNPNQLKQLCLACQEWNKAPKDIKKRALRNK